MTNEQSQQLAEKLAKEAKAAGALGAIVIVAGEFGGLLQFYRTVGAGVSIDWLTDVRAAVLKTITEPAKDQRVAKDEFAKKYRL